MSLTVQYKTMCSMYLVPPHWVKSEHGSVKLLVTIIARRREMSLRRSYSLLQLLSFVRPIINYHKILPTSSRVPDCQCRPFWRPGGLNFIVTEDHSSKNKDYS
jgi:hypothetical protein